MMAMSALIAFLMAAVNIPFALNASSSVSWMNWVSAALCFVIETVQLIFMAVHRDR